MLQHQSHGREVAQAWAAFDAAFNLLGLGDVADRHTILDLADAALAHLGIPERGYHRVGELFVAARRQDAARLIAIMRGAQTVSRSDLGILLLTIEFLLRANEYQHDRGSVADQCGNCGSPHLVREGDERAQRCLACGLTTNYPAYGV